MNELFQAPRQVKAGVPKGGHSFSELVAAIYTVIYVNIYLLRGHINNYESLSIMHLVGFI